MTLTSFGRFVFRFQKTEEERKEKYTLKSLKNVFTFPLRRAPNFEIERKKIAGEKRGKKSSTRFLEPKPRHTKKSSRSSVRAKYFIAQKTYFVRVEVKNYIVYCRGINMF